LFEADRHLLDALRAESFRRTVRRDRPRPDISSSRRVDPHLREDRRTGIVAAEFAELPLPRHHPERVAHFARGTIELVARGRPSTGSKP
jgi:hypothetical protein